MHPKHKHRSKEEILSLLRLYHESGMSKSGFCRSHGVSCPALLNRWLSKWGNDVKELSSQSEPATYEIMANRSKEDYRAEIADLRRRLRAAERALEFSKLETEVRDLMIDRAEELYDLPIRKKCGAK